MEIMVKTPITAEAEVKKYTLVGDDIYIKRYTNENIPEWYRTLISNIIALDPTITDINGAIDYLSTLSNGYSMMITELQNGQSIINTSLTSLVAKDDQHTAAIANLDITKVDATSATAISNDTVAAYFNNGSAGAWFNNQISTYASNIQANASNISTLSSTLNGVTARIDSIDTTLVTLNGWSASASKLITGPDGGVTGWSFADGSNIQSNFKIKAQNFSISDGVTGYTPFSISGSNILFNGKVEFTNVLNVPSLSGIHTFYQSTTPTATSVGDIWYDTGNGYKMSRWNGTSWSPVYETIIDGGRITTNTLNADRITSGTITAGKIVANELEIAGAPFKANSFTLGTATELQYTTPFTNDVTATICDWSWTVPASVVSNSRVVVNAGYIIMNNGGVTYPLVTNIQIRRNTTSIGSSQIGRRVIEAANVNYYGITDISTSASGTYSSGDTVNVRMYFTPLSGASNLLIDRIYINVAVLNKAT